MTAKEIAKYAYKLTYNVDRTFVIYNGVELVGGFQNNIFESDINMKDNEWKFLKISDTEEITLDGVNISNIEIKRNPAIK